MAQTFQPSAFYNSAFEVGYFVNLTKGTYTFTGNTAGVTRATLVAGAQGAYSLAGNTGAFKRTYILAAAKGTYATSPGANDAVDYGHAVAGAQGIYTITGRADGGRRYSYAQAQGSLAITGNAVVLRKTWLSPALNATYALTSVGVSLQYTGHYTLDANPVRYTITGRNATFFLLRALNTTSGAYTITGGAQDALDRGLQLPLTKGVYSFTYNTANFSITMPADKGTYLIGGNPGARNITRNPLLAGTFTFTGYTASFGLGMPADRGTYAITGNASSLRDLRRSFPLNQSFALSGYTSAMTRTARLPASAGSLTVASTGVAFALVRRLVIPTASYSFSGNSIAFGKIRGLSADYRAFSLTFHLQGFVGARLSLTDGHGTDGGDLSPRTMIVSPLNRIMGA